MRSPSHAPLPSPLESAPGISQGDGQPAATTNVVHPEVWHEFVDLYATIARVRGDDLAVLFLDINGLKAANDELGHEAGDLLIETVERIADEIPKQLRGSDDELGRPADLVMSHPSSLPELELPDDIKLALPQRVRTGGDEFGVILPNTDEAGAHIVAERLRETAENNPGNESLKELGVGVAVGVAAMRSGRSASDTMRSADEAMYEDKIRQVRPLSPEQQAEFLAALEHLENAGVRPRDVPKYVQIFGASAVTNAFESQTGDL